MIPAFAEADRLEQPLHRLAPLGSLLDGRSECDLDVLGRGKRRNQVELLKDEADRAQAKRRELAITHRRHVPAFEANASGRRTVEAAEEL